MTDTAIAWLRDLDGTGSLHVCAKDDPGAFPIYGAEDTKADLVKRLRNSADATREAAGRIEALNKRVRAVEHAANENALILDAAEAENTRLREALEEVLKECQVAAPGPHWRWHDEYYEAFNVARAALSKGDG